MSNIQLPSYYIESSVGDRQLPGVFYSESVDTNPKIWTFNNRNDNILINRKCAFSFVFSRLNNRDLGPRGIVLSRATPTPAFKAGMEGVMVATGGARAYLNTIDNPIPTSNGSGSGDYLLIGSLQPVASASPSAALHIRLDSGGFQSIWVRCNSYYPDNSTGSTTASGYFYVGEFNTISGNTRGVYSSNAVNGRLLNFAYSRVGSIRTLYINGVFIGTSTYSPAQISTAGQLFSIGGSATFTGVNANYPIYLLHAENRGASNAELQALSTNPWQIFQPDRLSLYFNTVKSKTNCKPKQTIVSQPQNAIKLDLSHPLASSASLIYVGSSVGRSIVPAKTTIKTGTANKTGAKGVATGFSSTDGTASTDSVLIDKTDNCPRFRTYFALVKVSSANNSALLGRIFDKRDASNDTQVEVFYADQGVGFNYFTFGGFFATNGAWTSPVNSLIPDTWQTVAVRYDRSTTSSVPDFYIDGNRVTTSTRTAPTGASLNNAAKYVIGNRTSDNLRVFNGQIACLYFFDKLLTNTEIASLHANPWQIFQPDYRLSYLSPKQNKVNYLPKNIVNSQPTNLARVASWINPKDLWLPLQGRMTNVIRDLHSTGKSSTSYFNQSYYGNSIGDSPSATNDKGFYTSAFTSASPSKWYTGATELTIFAIASANSLSSIFSHLLRVEDNNPATGAGQVDLSVRNTSGNLVLSNLFATTVSNGWSISAYTSLGPVSNFDITKPMLYIQRWKSGSAPQAAAANIGSSKISFVSSSVTPSGTIGLSAGGPLNLIASLGGINYTQEYQWNGKIYLVGVLPYYIRDQDASRIALNPWQIFQSDKLPALLSPSTVSSVSLSYLRPASDISTGDWTPSSGTSLYETLNEVYATDSDYIQTTTASTCEIKLSAGNTPSIKEYHTLKYRLLPGTGNLSIALKCGTTTIKTWNHTLTNIAQDISNTLTVAEATNITDYSNIRVVCTSY